MSNAHNSKEFFIGGNMVLVRPLQASESVGKKTYQELLASSDLSAMGELQHVPSGTLSELTELPDSFVYVAVSEENDQDNPLGIALYVKNEITGAHEMSILISKQYIGTRLTYELADSLIVDAATHRVMTLYTVDRSDDIEMRKLAKKLDMSVRLVSGSDRQTMYTLQVDEHPGVVVF